MDNNELPTNYYKHVRREMLPYIPNGIDKVLDVGCAEGMFGAILKNERNVEVWGIELNVDAATIASTKLDKVITGSAEQVNEALPERFFDCIIFNDVLEHLIDPWSVLKTMTNKLKSGGSIVVSIPNIRYYKVLDDLLFHNKFVYQNEGVLDRTHLRFFTANTIKSMLTECGLIVELLKGLQWFPLPLRYKIINRIAFRAFDDIKFKQFVCVARKQSIESEL